MRIAHLTWSMGIGGTQTMLTDIVNIQVQEGHEVGIFVIDTYVSDTIMKKLDSRVKVFFMGRTRGEKAILPFVKLNWYLWKYKPDIMHSHAIKLRKVVFLPVPKVVTIHTVGIKLKDIVGYDLICAISKTVKQYLEGIGCKNVLLNEDGIWCDKIKQRTVYNKSDEIHVVQVSRIYLDIKGQDLVVRALRQVVDKMKEDPVLAKKKCIVHFVGDGIDTEKLKQITNELKLDDNVVFEGFKDREWVYQHLCDFDLFVQASRYEGFGLTVAEACAAKIPVMVSDIDGPLEIIDNGNLGMTFKCGDHEDLAKQLYRFICGEYDYSLVEKAYQRTLTRYSIERTTHEYIEEYERLLAKK